MRRFVHNQTDPTAVILISGIDIEAMSAVTVSTQWDVPNAAVVRHEIDIAREVLVRAVSDRRGVIERQEITLSQRCVSCATREDLVASLRRLSGLGTWDTLIAQLPPAVDAAQVCRAVAHSPEDVARFRVSAVVAALAPERVVEDLIGDDLLIERGLPVRDDEDRGVGETMSAQVEYADLIIGEDLSRDAYDLLTLIARPEAAVLTAASQLNAALLTADLHQHESSEGWVQVVRRGPFANTSRNSAWMVDLHSDRPFHPGRLRERVEDLGRGRRRSRGCFWLPSRPGQILQWDGAGGMVNIGVADEWHGEGPLTRITVVGADSGKEALLAAFNDCLLTDQELTERGPYWEVGSDGMEPWLGPVPYLMKNKA